MADNIEHEIQRLMLERLGIEWTPGEPFYSLVETEIEQLTQRALYAERVWKELGASREQLKVENKRLRAAIVELQQDVERLQQQRAEQMLKRTGAQG